VVDDVFVDQHTGAVIEGDDVISDEVVVALSSNAPGSTRGTVTEVELAASIGPDAVADDHGAATDEIERDALPIPGYEVARTALVPTDEIVAVSVAETVDEDAFERIAKGSRAGDVGTDEVALNDDAARFPLAITEIDADTVGRDDVAGTRETAADDRVVAELDIDAVLEIA